MKNEFEKREIAENENCEYIEQCSIHRKSLSGHLNSLFVILYCRGIRLGWCECRKVFLSGQTPPETMLPNGEYIKKQLNVVNIIRF